MHTHRTHGSVLPLRPSRSAGHCVAGSLIVILAVVCSHGQGNAFTYCPTTPDYQSVGQMCYVDSRNGSDSSNGLTPATPVRSQSAIPTSARVICYKRGSVFHERLALKSTATVYTNYGDTSEPLPRFIVPSATMSGPVIQALMRSGVTFDGLFLAGARGDGTMAGLMGGIAVMLGANSRLLNCEITSCDIGAMVTGDGCLVRGCHIHDLIMGVDGEPGVDPNLVGGAEGIFVNASNCEVSYNAFVNCSGPAEWVGQNGGCDGGAVEVTAGAGDTVSGVSFHHNFALDDCGFFEVSSGFGGTKGWFINSEFHSNLIVDCGWMGLLQVNNTNLAGIRYYQNTLVQHKGSTNAGIVWIIFTDTSSGMSGGRLEPNTVFLTNNLYVLDSIPVYWDLIDTSFVDSGNLVIKAEQTNPGFVNLAGTRAADFDLTQSGPARGTGSPLANNVPDYFNRPVANLAHPDVGAFQYGTSQAECIRRPPAYDSHGTAGIRTMRAAGRAVSSMISVSLNPATSMLTVAGLAGVSQSLRMELYDMQGKRVYRTVHGGSTASCMMDVSALAPGVYTVRVARGDEVRAQQVVMGR